ncbi:MAG: ABC transporter substrate-binding protein [Candidatus Phytoplasma australasiaticum]|uniref:ABC transporter substrate-binding protein n=2 Tax=16SrII (Peanut WB group) TaxID=85621 RepID=A0A9K3STB3_9MOLU|nr:MULTISPECIES: ABC transporter substrate-binding protein [Phytoplasma]MCG3566539.1 ABC transporter substrate-binding protein [Sesame phyllody phytoplasma]MDO8030935.1 ABC transporter substrate-binding protein [Candidatus Phytoplasma australasiaticum]MDO8031412.1 ABC transporter substrate-binding protein [Candidatus Phytoplasma australasiaticum]MDO8046453.1 ABC transporter substrate-binding protein [Candidatus Phytoplasma australasiaticum]MDO8053010.1 ABC transporter substrate-binding protein
MSTKKKIIIIIWCLFIIFIANLYRITYHNSAKQSIILFNWGEYIDPKIISDYNNKSNDFVIKQNFFSSNEIAINKIKTGDVYDIAILSEYAIEQLKDNYLNKIDKNKLINYPELNENFQKIQKDKLPINIKEYIIPYFWGKLGFLYNKQKITKDQISKHWTQLLQNNDYKVALYNNPFEGIFIGLKATQGNISQANPTEINKAKNWLLNLKQKNKNLFFVTDQILDNMRIANQERYDIAVTYSGDARYLMQQNPNLEYYDFNDHENNIYQTNIWVDSLVLPKGSNTKGAYDFINFLLKNDNLKQNTSFVGYDSPYQNINENNNSLKININDKDNIYKYNVQTKKQINDAWNEVYAYPRPQDKYLLLLCFLIIIICLIIKFKINWPKNNKFLINKYK